MKHSCMISLVAQTGNSHSHPPKQYTAMQDDQHPIQALAQAAYCPQAASTLVHDPTCDSINHGQVIESA